LAQASAIGLSAVTAIVLGLALGLWLDGRLGTKPWLTLGGLLLGVVAGLRNIFILAARVERDEKADHDPQPR
jgi:ATP synthase protein I